MMNLGEIGFIVFLVKFIFIWLQYETYKGVEN